MKTQHLMSRWQSLSRHSGPHASIVADIDIHDAARLQALAEMYPGCSAGSLLADLLHEALDELEAAFPYVNGQRQVGEDEFGDPLYEDAGPTPRFLALTQQHLRKMQQGPTEGAPRQQSAQNPQTKAATG